MEAEGYDDGYSGEDGVRETVPLADQDDGYHSEEEGEFRDDKTPYDDDADGVYRDGATDESPAAYRDDAGDYDENASYHSNSRPMEADDDDDDSVNKPRHMD